MNTDATSDCEAPLPERPSLQFTLKVASRCNLACKYCYVYEKGDESWRLRPGIMTERVFLASVERIREHCSLVGQTSIEVVFHGGEPCLVGVDRFARWCDHLRERLSDIGNVTITLQTNGTLVDARWALMLAEHDVAVGVSLDGPALVNDSERVDKKGHGTHDQVVAGIGELCSAGLPVNILSVVQLGRDPIWVHEHLVSLGAGSITYLMPDQTHETIADVHREFGPTPCADFLNPILDHWLAQDTLTLTVQPFKEMARAVLGGSTRVDFLGNNPYRYVFIEANGSIEGLDVLRVCQPGLAVTGLDVFHNQFLDIVDRSALHRQMIFEGMPLPADCMLCPEATTCAGGYVPHRWADGHFDHRSAWCEDLLAIFSHLRVLLDVSPRETLLRRGLLEEIRVKEVA